MLLDKDVTVDRRKIITHSAFYHYFTIIKHATNPLLNWRWRSLRYHTRTHVEVYRHLSATLADGSATAAATAVAAGTTGRTTTGAGEAVLLDCSGGVTWHWLPIRVSSAHGHV